MGMVEECALNLNFLPFSKMSLQFATSPEKRVELDVFALEHRRFKYRHTGAVLKLLGVVACVVLLLLRLYNSGWIKSSQPRKAQTSNAEAFNWTSVRPQQLL